MKTLTVILATIVLSIQVSGYLIKVPTAPTAAAPTVTGNTQWMHIQKLMNPLFENVCETSSNPIILRLAQEFTLEPADYFEPGVITSLKNLISTGLLPKGTIFTEYNPNHMNELKIIYDILHNAKNFDTFYTAAAWARQNLNCALYVSAIYLAIQNRRDTERLSIPAPYELLPNYFIDKDVIIKASSIFAGEEITSIENIRYEGNFYTIDANYTAPFYDNDDESKLAYFREDIGLNSYYFLRKLNMGPWLNDDVNGGFGENMYQMMKQFMARYNLERYANGLPEIDSLNWHSLNDIPYDPLLIYSDGNEFSHRTSSLDLPENEDLLLLQTIESNIVAVASHMRQSEYNKTQILNHLMEILVTSDRSYETLARQLLGKDLTNNGYGSVLEHYMTSLRDPMFWKINKKIVDMVDDALKILPRYARNELYFPGVEVVNVEVKKMTTACDYFGFDVTDALKIEESNSKFKIRIGQPRLNHKPFTIKVNVSSLVSQKGIIKIYLGPKLMPGELAAKKNLFMLLDVFEITLKKGSNIITRSSDNMKQFSDDFMLLDTIRKKIEDAEFGLDSLPLKTIQSQVGYPSRLILPKGTPQGLPLQMFVFIAPYVKGNLGESYTKNNMEFNTAVLSPGYPLDLMIDDGQLFELPNAMIKYITVTQKSDSKVENYGGPGISKSWYGPDTYDSSSQPDYNSKSGQYGRNTNYAVKVNEFNVDVNDFGSDDRNEDEYYGMIGLNDKPNSHVNKLGYSAKGAIKEPFDYKSKKAQYDNKNYSAKRDYTKYRPDPKYVPDIMTSTPTIELISTTAKLVNILVDEDNAKLDSINKDNYINVNKYGDLSADDVIQKDLLQVEPLPLPAMLKKDPEEKEKFDYKAKKTQRDFTIKEKKTLLDILIKEAKRKEYIKNQPVTTTSEATVFNSEEIKGKVILSKDHIKLDNRIANDLTSKPLEFVNLKRVDGGMDGKVVNNQPDVYTLHSSDPKEKAKFDYKAIKTERDDKIKARKNELDNLIKEAKQKEYIKNLPVTTINEPVVFNSVENKGKIILSKDDIELYNQIPNDVTTKPDNVVNLNKKDYTNNIGVDEAITEHSIKIDGADIPILQKDSEEDEPILISDYIKKHSPTMYNYLLRSLVTDHSDIDWQE